MADPNCTRCKGQGWYWRTPDGFNPFLAGGFSTARAMFKVTCSCAPGETPTINTIGTVGTIKLGSNYDPANNPNGIVLRGPT